VIITITFWSILVIVHSQTSPFLATFLYHQSVFFTISTKRLVIRKERKEKINIVKKQTKPLSAQLKAKKKASSNSSNKSKFRESF
jgi:hypothetical protein